MANCEHCQSWTVKGASFCFKCGNPLSVTFEYSSDAASPQMEKISIPGGQWKDKAATTALLAMAMSAGTLFADFEPSFIALVPLGYLLWEPASNLILDVLGKLPDKPVESSTTLKVEYKSENNKHWILADFPPNIELSHIQHIAKKCLSPPMGEGDSFSRRKVTKAGTLSQGEFEAIRDFFLETNFAFYKNSNAPNLGIQLTERCTRLLKRSLVVGGGWLTDTHKSHLQDYVGGDRSTCI